MRMLAIGADWPRIRRYLRSVEKKSRDSSPQWLLKRSKEDPDFKPDWINSAYDQIDTALIGLVAPTRGSPQLAHVLHDHVKREELGITAKTNLLINLPVSDLIVSITCPCPHCG